MKIGIYALGLGDMAVPQLRQIGTHETPHEQVRNIVKSRFEGWLKMMEAGERLVIVAESAEPYIIATERISALYKQGSELVWVVDESVGF